MTRGKKILVVAGSVLALLVLATVLLYALMNGFGRPLTSAAARGELENLFAEAVAEESVHNAVLLVRSARLGIDGQWAGGIASQADATPMTVDAPFLSASVGKLFTAVVVLTLVDDGLVALDDPVVNHISRDTITRLPLADSHHADAITIRHLLGHRSGLPDYFASTTRDGAPNVAELLVQNTARQWSVDELLAYTSDHFEAVGSAGQHFEYADTNYDLLGLVVDAKTGMPFHQALRERVLAPLGLTHTWSYQKEPAPGGVRYADVFSGTTNLAGVAALSLDGAGGGLATTLGDLEEFLRALLIGEPVALERLQVSWTQDSLTRGIDYGLGLWRIHPPRLFPLLDMADAYGVSGATGSFVYWVPDYDALLAGSFNQFEWTEEHVVFLIRVLQVLDRVQPTGRP